jgi:hypothetical protein
MAICAIHSDFFNDTCEECKKEYAELKGLDKSYLDNYDKSKIDKNQKESTKNFQKNEQKGCMKI